jgi:hypothetical protein
VTDALAQPDAPLPTDASEAMAMRERLVADTEYMKDWKTDNGKQSTLGYLRWVATGNPPELWGAPPETPSDIHMQENDRAQLQIDQHAAALRTQYPLLTDQQIHEITNRRPLTAEQKDWFARQYDMKFKDAAHWDRHDHQANGERFLFSAAKSAPFARDLAEQQAWDKVFPFKGAS